MKLGRNHSVLAESVATSCHYSVIDRGSGRCRLSAEAFEVFDLKIGWIVVLQLPSYESYLLTAWPDHMNELKPKDAGADTMFKLFYDATVRCPFLAEDKRADCSSSDQTTAKVYIHSSLVDCYNRKFITMLMLIMSDYRSLSAKAMSIDRNRDV
jgi:hypothetical protein